MIRLRLYCSVLLLVLGMTSCDKWLDRAPSSELYGDDVFQHAEGFVKGLAACYAAMGTAELYGRDLEFGMLDVMAGYWEVNTSHIYSADYAFDYQDPALKNRLSLVWSGMYGIIHQVNIMLEQVDNIQGEANYALIKGELLGLRAFLHFELLKLFGPVYGDKGMDELAIPYYTTADRLSSAFLSARACFDRIEADLQEAKLCLSDDPIRTVGRAGDGNRRGIRMNYFAVMALLARKAQWAGNMEEAGKRAQALLDALDEGSGIRFIGAAEVQQPDFMDYRFTMENLWGLYVKDIADYTQGYLTGQLLSDRLLLPANTGFLDNIYVYGTGNPSDLRYNFWRINTRFAKFRVLSEDVSQSELVSSLEVQLINLPEMYFILAEAYLEKDMGTSLTYINMVREHRQLPLLTLKELGSKEALGKLLLDEVRREYIGEGYLFSYYKHLGHAVLRPVKDVEADKHIFLFPIPDDEQIYNPK